MTGLLFLPLAAMLASSGPPLPVEARACSADAARRVAAGLAFARVLAMADAGDAFGEAAALDPACARAHWGLALVNLPWPGDVPTRLAEARARDALVRASPAATPDDRRWIDALAALFEPADDPFARRRIAYRDRLRRLVAEHPDDDAAVVWLALAELSLSAAPGDDAAREAAQVIRDRFGRVPDEAGAAFVLLLALDGLPADGDLRAVADALADTEPAAVEARHVCARAYRRLGLWEQAVLQDEAAIGLVAPAADHRRLVIGPDGRWFVPESLVTSYLEQGRFARARALVASTAARIEAWPAERLAALEAAQRALARMRVRVLLEAEAWEEARALETAGQLHDATASSSDLDWFARGMGAARGAWADQDAEAFAAAREAAAELDRLARADGPSSEAMRRWLLVRAAIAGGQYERDEMTVLLGEARRVEEALGATGRLDRPLVWADEVAGDLRLQVDQPGHARLRYEALLARQPRRARALLGLARAHRALGNRDEARAAYDAFLEVWAQADRDRPELRDRPD